MNLSCKQTTAGVVSELGNRVRINDSSINWLGSSAVCASFVNWGSPSFLISQFWPFFVFQSLNHSYTLDESSLTIQYPMCSSRELPTAPGGHKAQPKTLQGRISLAFIIDYVFLPPEPPSKSGYSPEHKVSFIRVFRVCPETFPRHLKPQNNSRSVWDVIVQVTTAGGNYSAPE